MAITIDKMDISNKAAQLRKKFGIDEEAQLDIVALAMNIPTLTLVFYPLGKNISGMCQVLDNSSVVTINSSMSKGRQRFTLAHELYHLLYDKEMMTVCSKVLGKLSDIEEKANIFASYLLIPATSLYNKVAQIRESKDKLELVDIVKLEQYYGVSRMALLHRLKEENILTDDAAKEFSTDIIPGAAGLGYPTDLYKASAEEDQMITLGHYITLADKVYEAGRISNGAYESFLLDAFRADLVYGEYCDEGGELVD